MPRYWYHITSVKCIWRTTVTLFFDLNEWLALTYLLLKKSGTKEQLTVQWISSSWIYIYKVHCAVCNTSLTSVYSIKFYSCFSLSHQFRTHSRSHTPISIFKMEWGPWLLGKRGVLGKQSRRYFPEPTAVKGSSTVQQVWNKWRHSKGFKRKFSSWEIFLFISKEFSICKNISVGHLQLWPQENSFKILRCAPRLSHNFPVRLGKWW